jgi:hypothetical protein
MDVSSVDCYCQLQALSAFHAGSRLAFRMISFSSLVALVISCSSAATACRFPGCVSCEPSRASLLITYSSGSIVPKGSASICTRYALFASWSLELCTAPKAHFIVRPGGNEPMPCFKISRTRLMSNVDGRVGQSSPSRCGQWLARSFQVVEPVEAYAPIERAAAGDRQGRPARRAHSLCGSNKESHRDEDRPMCLLVWPRVQQRESGEALGACAAMPGLDQSFIEIVHAWPESW